jgi:hypothetical protein
MPRTNRLTKLVGVSIQTVKLDFGREGGHYRDVIEVTSISSPIAITILA